MENKKYMSTEEFSRRLDAILEERRRRERNNPQAPPRPIAAANPNVAMIPYEPDEIDTKDTTKKQNNK